MRFVIKNSSVPGKVPLVTDLEIGEIAFNLHDKKIFSKDNNNMVIDITGSSSSSSGSVPEIDMIRMSLGII